MEIQERQDAAGGVRLISYCPRHCTPKPEQSGAHAGSASGGCCLVGLWLCWQLCVPSIGALCCLITCPEVGPGSLKLFSSSSDHV